MKMLTALACLVVAAAPATAVPQQRADPSQLNSKHGLLRIQVGSINGGVFGMRSEIADELTRFAVNATIAVSVPSSIGAGHGPFRWVYAKQPQLRAIDGLSITKTDETETFGVRCTREGVFELAIEVVGLDGKPMSDVVEIGCIAPTRFEATVVSDTDTARYLAAASEVRASLVWFGPRDGREVPLIGAAPVDLPDDSPLAVTAQGADLRLDALRAAKSPVILSGGQRVTLPIEIVEPKTWTLDVAITTKNRAVSVRARALDAKGQPFAGLSRCAMSSVSGAVEMPRSKYCRMALSVSSLERWRADQMCATVLGKRACAATK